MQVQAARPFQGASRADNQAPANASLTSSRQELENLMNGYVLAARKVKTFYLAFLAAR